MLLFVDRVAGEAPKLKHVQPKENASLTQAKILKAVEGKHELHQYEQTADSSSGDGRTASSAARVPCLPPLRVPFSQLHCFALFLCVLVCSVETKGEGLSEAAKEAFKNKVQDVPDEQ